MQGIIRDIRSLPLNPYFILPLINDLFEIPFKVHSSIHKRVNVNDVRKLLGILFFQGILLFSELAYRKNHFFFTLANYILFGLGNLLIFLKSLNVDWSLENSDYLATTYRIFESCSNPDRENLEYFESSSLLLHIESFVWEIIVYSMLFFVKRYLYEMFPFFRIF